MSNKNNNQEDNIEDAVLSKTQIKAQMDEIYIIGKKLTTISKNQLIKLNLPSEILEAINFVKTISSHGALKRQHQYIAKLMRQYGYEYIKEQLNKFNQSDEFMAKLVYDCEYWRKQLIASDDILQEFITQNPSCDIVNLRYLIKASRSELMQKDNALDETHVVSNKNYQKLFQVIRNLLER